MSRKPLKVLITPHTAVPYDIRMVKGFAEGLNEIGYYGVSLANPVGSSTP
jgi:hypothetical protein